MKTLQFKRIIQLQIIIFVLVISIFTIINNKDLHSVQAVDFSVSSEAELSQAITAANNNSEEDAITLLANITLTGPLPDVTSDIIINGAGYTIDINNHSRMTNVTGTLTLNNISIINGNNDSSSGGGAILNAGGSLIINDSTFSSNTATANGGSIYNTGILTITDSTFVNNSAVLKGGAIHNEGGTFNVIDTNLTLNTSLTGGGAISNIGINASGVIEQSFFSDNSAENDGGGIFSNSSLTVSHSSFFGNSAGTNDGGGIFNLGELHITNSTMASNTARRGGGLYNSSSGSISVNNCTFSGNISDYGGGILNYTRSINNSINNSTFHNNTANSSGGGIRNNGILELNHNLISGNIAPVGAEFYHSISDNAITSANNFNLFAHSGLTDANAYYNFIPDLNDYNASSNIAPSTGNNTPLTDILNATLEDNGGPTLTHALVTGSPAVDSYTDTLSSCPSTDQRGIDRPWPNGGYCDSGAYELQYVTLTIISEHGIVELNPNTQTIQLGDVITLTAIPDPHYSFDGWSGDLTSSENPLVVTMNGDLTLTANFLQIHFSLLISKQGEGIIEVYPESPYGDSYYNPGEVVNLTAIPAPGWSFSGWSGDASGSTNPISITIDTDTNVTALFTQNEYTLEITKEHGSVVLDPDKSTYHYGDTVTLTAISDPGWSFKGWSGDLVSTKNPVDFTITGNTKITATFVPNKIYLPIILK